MTMIMPLPTARRAAENDLKVLVRATQRLQAEAEALLQRERAGIHVGPEALQRVENEARLLRLLIAHARRRLANLPRTDARIRRAG